MLYRWKELHELQVQGKENKQLRVEKEILKKANASSQKNEVKFHL